MRYAILMSILLSACASSPQSGGTVGTAPERPVAAAQPPLAPPKADPVQVTAPAPATQTEPLPIKRKHNVEED